MTPQQATSRATAPLHRRIMNMLGRAVLRLVDDAAGLQRVQVTVLAGEVRDGVERFQDYGFTSHPLAGADALLVFLGGNRDHPVAVAVADRRHRQTGLEPGEVAVYDDQGQSVHLTRAGIVLRGAGRPVTITDALKVRIEADLEVTGQVKDLCDGAGRTMAGMREVYNGHTHPGDSGGTTGKPTEGM